jgi:hypothetical protein
MGAGIQRSYTDAEVERGLGALALCSGNGMRASRELKKQGLTIPWRTLYRWKEEKPDRYTAVQEEILPRVKEELAEMHTALGRAQVEVSRKLTERLAAEIGEVPTKDLAGNVQKLALASGIHGTKAAELRGEPTVIVETMGLWDTLKGMERRWGRNVIRVKGEQTIEGDAEELCVDASNGSDRQLQTSGPAQPDA